MSLRTKTEIGDDPVLAGISKRIASRFLSARNKTASAASHHMKQEPAGLRALPDEKPVSKNASQDATLDFETLVESFYMPLYRFAYSLTRQEADAADLTQQTFLLWAAKGHQLRDQSKVKSWLFTSLYREFLAGKKRDADFVESSSELNLVTDPTVALPADQLDSDSVIQALLDLEETYRAPLTLFYLQQLSYREISGTLAVPMGTVMSRISRGKALLRKALADRYPLAQSRP